MPENDPAAIVVYASSWCPYCHWARKLLDKKGVFYQLISVDGDPEVRRTMRERAGGRNTVPQIFIGERHIGGFDDLAALDQRGQLDALLPPPSSNTSK